MRSDETTGGEARDGMTVRVRFAPSPTGFLHVGGARTALYNWLFAQRNGGEFILRVEDTDRRRSRPEHTRAILDGLAWLGMIPDGDPAFQPVFQADGVSRHRADARRLLAAGAAYRCFCTADELKKEREETVRRRMARKVAARDGQREGSRRDLCRLLDPAESAARAEVGEPFALRVKAPDEAIGWDDMIHGPMSYPAGSIGDFIVLRSDGTPVYNLAAVSDDIHSMISHVIRGDDHLSNTPKQILIYRALGKPLPDFGHVPMIRGPDGKRLSKRHGAMSVTDYRDDGYLPEGMINFLALLGWSPGDDREVFGVDELVEAFSFRRVLKKSAVFDLDKFGWLNGQHIARSPADSLAGPVVEALTGIARQSGRTIAETHPGLAENYGLASNPSLADGAESDERRRMQPADESAQAPGLAKNAGSADTAKRLAEVIDLVKCRPRTLHALARQVSPFFAKSIDYDEDAVARFWKNAGECAGHMRHLAKRLVETASWDTDALEREVRGLAAERGVGAGRIINPLRVALMGQSVAPGIFDVLATMGRGLVLERLADAVRFLDARAALPDSPLPDSSNGPSRGTPDSGQRAAGFGRGATT